MYKRQELDRKQIQFGAAGAGLSQEEAEEWKNALTEAFPGSNVYYNPPVSYTHLRIQSTTRHVEPCGKSGGPPPKAKYSLVTDSA